MINDLLRDEYRNRYGQQHPKLNKMHFKNFLMQLFILDKIYKPLLETPELISKEFLDATASLHHKRLEFKIAQEISEEKLLECLRDEKKKLKHIIRNDIPVIQ
jgi:hypothetical protein